MPTRSKSLIQLALIVSFFLSCKEKPSNNIIFDDDHQTLVKDTSYIDDIEQPQLKNVLAEEFTGVSCSACPGARKTLEGLKDRFNDRFIIVAYYPKKWDGLTKPLSSSKFDFRREKGAEINDFLPKKASGMPMGGINRVNENSEGVWTAKGDWSIATEKEIKKNTNVNIDVTSNYDADTRKATIKVKVAYTKDVTDKNHLTLVLTEDNLIDPQKDGLTIIDAYNHKDVMREVFTHIYGDPILDSLNTKEAGRVLEKTYVIDVNKDWKQEDCKIIAFVHNNEANNKEVLQTAKVNLTN